MASMNAEQNRASAHKTLTTAPAPGAGNAAPRRTINWFRFWIQMGIAMIVFNIIAAFVTAYFIFPHLHPAR